MAVVLNNEEKKIVKQWLIDNNFYSDKFFNDILKDEGYGDILALKMAKGEEESSPSLLSMYVYTM